MLIRGSDEDLKALGGFLRFSEMQQREDSDNLSRMVRESGVMNQYLVFREASRMIREDQEKNKPLDGYEQRRLEDEVNRQIGTDEDFGMLSNY